MFLDRQDVRRAFGADEFYPLFQPQVHLGTGKLSGFEALARWNHAQLGLISPDAFIPIVQKDGLINTLTQKLLEKIFAVAPQLPDTARMSINLSPLQLLDETIPDRIAEAAERGGFPLDRLTIEMTEGALREDLARAQAVVLELKNLHCRLSLDDFGTRHSSLFHLQDLPFDELKVDRSFIHAMHENRTSRNIVSAVVGLGKSMGLTTLAEGVETEEEAGILLEMGCVLAQGWFFGRPAPAEEIPRMIAAAESIGAAV
jgi:EAL domain-containing protein (putative c-di-GMP-specific phosphodiesterase class I)